MTTQQVIETFKYLIFKIETNALTPEENDLVDKISLWWEGFKRGREFEKNNRERSIRVS